MKKLIYLSALILASCGGSKETEETPESEDTVKKEDVAVEDTTAGRTEAEEPETIEAVEAEGAGMSFCDCVKKMKELDDKLMTEEDEVKLNAILAEKEKLADGECSVIKAGSQTTPAQRAERARKVKECLGN
jgi:hypothetical protein